MKHLKLFEGRNSSSPFGNKEVCYKQKRSLQANSYYTEIVHIPTDDETGLYIEAQIDKLSEEKTVIKCGTYKKEGAFIKYTNFKG
jgi:hypothetical protein